MLTLNLNLLYTVVNVLILFLLLRKFLYKPVMGIIAQRQKQVDDALNAAETSKQEAVAALNDAQAKLRNVDAEAAARRETYEQQAETAKQQLLAEAQKQADAIVAEGKAAAEAERQHKLREADAQTTALARAMCEKLLARNLTAQDDARLLDDLLEASKATTGNLEVHPEVCDVSVLLSQAAGEYEQRFSDKKLETIVKQPEETVKVMADGRHLWRVFDNLLNNIYKYAQAGSRVYLNVEHDGQDVRIIFRNMSAFPLEMSPEELEERFTRGDKSRHMEGNGLGLSIAKSLTELQNGDMQIVTDGDLFKVVITLPETE